VEFGLERGESIVWSTLITTPWALARCTTSPLATFGAATRAAPVAAPILSQAALTAAVVQGYHLANAMYRPPKANGRQARKEVA